jgi:ring-1,2-phenylacetyl-CoA epoxidase subunit PaaD
MVSGAVTRDDVFAILDEVKDPEVPVLSVVELGIVRDVAVDGRGVTVTITPTYSGCPAMRVIEEDITAALEARGLSPIRLETVYAPAWTTEWMSAEAKQKLSAYGIAPPGRLQEASRGRLARIAGRRTRRRGANSARRRVRQSCTVERVSSRSSTSSRYERTRISEPSYPDAIAQQGRAILNPSKTPLHLVCADCP